MIATQIIVNSTMILASAAITMWVAGAIYFDVCRGTKWARWVAMAWIVCTIGLFATWQPLWQPFVLLLGVTAILLCWWLTLKPSQNRDWDPSVAVLPQIARNGDSVTIENVRNFDYRSLADFTPCYETRTVYLAALRAADIVFFAWGSPWMSHPVLVFDFGPDGRICISIEVRYRKSQEYSVIRSLYRQQELIFVVADERDVILRRTKYSRGQEAYLFRFQADPAELRASFLDYVTTIESLSELPRWYHGLCANCTTSFYRLPGSRVRWDWRVIANGRLDKALYEANRLDQTLPFPELRRNAYLNDIANRAPKIGFGNYIRRELERRRHER